MNPAKAKSHEDRQVDCRSYKNITDWAGRVQNYLINIDMLKPESECINGLWSNCSPTLEKHVDPFITRNETYHKFSTADKKGEVLKHGIPTCSSRARATALLKMNGTPQDDTNLLFEGKRPH